MSLFLDAVHVIRRFWSSTENIMWSTSLNILLCECYTYNYICPNNMSSRFSISSEANAYRKSWRNVLVTVYWNVNSQPLIECLFMFTNICTSPQNNYYRNYYGIMLKSSIRLAFFQIILKYDLENVLLKIMNVHNSNNLF